MVVMDEAPMAAAADILLTLFHTYRQWGISKPNVW